MSITSAEVEAILGSNWDGVTDLSPYLRASSMLMKAVLDCAARKSVVIASDVQDELSRWLSAYSYTIMDPLYKSKSTMGASGSFGRDPKYNDYLLMAMQIDPSNCVKAVTQAQSAGGAWLGKTQAETTTFEERN